MSSAPSFQYLAILGRQPELGLLELEACLGPAGVRPLGRTAAWISRELEVNRLGGVVKVGRVVYCGPEVKLSELADVNDLVLELPMNESKTPFAVSVYGSRASMRAVVALGLEFKKRLKARGSVRLVAPTDGAAVSAAQLRYNRVLEQGFELLVVPVPEGMVVAVTTSVQDVDWYSRRDYGRPARSARVGMLPPKLAQVLVNTTTGAPADGAVGAGVPVVDPFCGTGVVLQEALLLGRRAAGSDVAEEMVAASRANLAWLEIEAAQRPGPTPLPRWQVDGPVDARQVMLPAGAAVVSEGYLGPNLTHSPTPAELERIRSELRPLYREALRSWARQLPAGAEVSLCVPAWRRAGGWEYLGLVDELTDLGYTLKGYKHVRTPLLYARHDQVVGRQLLLLRKR